MAGDEIADRNVAGPIRHVLDVELGEALEELHGHVVDAAETGRSVIEMARLCPRQIDELLRSLHWQLLGNREHHRRLAEHRDGGKAWPRTVRQHRLNRAIE